MDVVGYCRFKVGASEDAPSIFTQKEWVAARENRVVRKFVGKIVRLVAIQLVLTGCFAASAREAPELIFEAAPGMEGVVDGLRSVDERALRGAMRLVGLRDGGPPIHVAIVPEGSPEALLPPGWSVAYAFSEAGRIILIPSRVPVYPDSNLPTVLVHEITHVLIARAAGRRPVPRWLHEGIAMAAAHEETWRDRPRLWWATWRRGGSELRRLEFAGGQAEAQRAYALSGEIVRYFLDEYGGDAAARLLAGIRQDLSFQEAFHQVTGATLAEVERKYWKQLDWWNFWVPVLSSSTTLWILISVLSLLAWKRRKVKDEKIREQWQLEDEVYAAALVEERRRRDVEEERRTASGEWVN